MSAGKWKWRLCGLHVGLAASLVMTLSWYLCMCLGCSGWTLRTGTQPDVSWVFVGAILLLFMSCLSFSAVPLSNRFLTALCSSVSPAIWTCTPWTYHHTMRSSLQMAKLLMRLSNSPSRKSDAFRNMTAPLIVTWSRIMVFCFTSVPVPDTAAACR